MADLYDRETTRAAIGGRYLAGCCTAFAIALSRRTGWPLVALRDGTGRLWHSGCRAPGGYADVRGVNDEYGFVDGFCGSVVPATEADLLVDHPQDDALIAQADLHAEMLFDLPGKSAQRIAHESFAAALDALCREHGIYLRGPGPGPSEGIVAYPAYGEERGFDVEMAPTGGSRLVRRLGRG
jgi:hypothetical protein